MRVSTQNVVFPLCAVLLMAGPALAQSGAATPAPAGSTGASSPAQPAEIVVTGSRIARRDYASESPIVTLGSAEIAAVGSPTLESALDQLPQLSTSASASADYKGRGGQASADLRGLGQQRTLVLVDGKRVQPSSPDGSVDLNIIPSALVDSIETITGGASSAYGSDAVTGVVNIKLRKNITGLEVNAQYGASDTGDSAVFDLNAILGGKFAEDRGSGYISLDYSNRDGTPQSARSYMSDQNLSTRLTHAVVNLNGSDLPSQASVNTVFAQYGVPAGTVKASSALIGTNNDGTLFTQNGAVNYRDTTTPEEEIRSGAVYSPLSDVLSIQVPFTRYNAYAHMDYDLNANVKAFAQVLFTHYSVDLPTLDVAYGTGNQPVSVPVTNPFIPKDLATLLASRPNPNTPFTIARKTPELGETEEDDIYNVFQATAGFTGTIPVRNWQWEIYGSYGQTNQTTAQKNYLSLSALENLLNSPAGGTEYCAGGYNPFNAAGFNKACAAYAERNLENSTNLSQGVVEADINGSVLRLPAGDLKVALGADYRQNRYTFNVDGEITANDIAFFNPITGSEGEESVAELYGEALVPVLANLPFVKSLELDLGYRFSDYDTVGSTSSYKASVDWAINDYVRLRGGYARAVRAPSVGELFGGATQSTSSLGTIGLVGQGDPCDFRSAYRGSNPNAAKVTALCTAQGVPSALIPGFQNLGAQTVYEQTGNSALQPETADTFTAGFVLRSPFDNPLFSRMSLSVDAYYIHLTGAIGYVTSLTTLQKCFNADGSNPTYSNTNYYCSLIQRNTSTGGLNLILNPELNLGGYKTSGLDVEGNWSFGLGAVGLKDDYGRVSLSSLVNYLNSFEIQTLPHTAYLQYADTIGNTQIDPFADAHPRWKATTTLAYQVGPITTDLRWRYLGAMSAAANVGTNGNAHGVVPVSYFDLDAAWKISPRLELRGGIENLLDRTPPIVNGSNVGVSYTDIYTYDLIGRRFFVALKAKF